MSASFSDLSVHLHDAFESHSRHVAVVERMYSEDYHFDHDFGFCGVVSFGNYRWKFDVEAAYGHLHHHLESLQRQKDRDLCISLVANLHRRRYKLPRHYLWSPENGGHLAR